MHLNLRIKCRFLTLSKFVEFFDEVQGRAPLGKDSISNTHVYIRYLIPNVRFQIFFQHFCRTDSRE